jgi:hypothetical protein
LCCSIVEADTEEDQHLVVVEPRGEFLHGYYIANRTFVPVEVLRLVTEDHPLLKLESIRLGGDEPLNEGPFTRFHLAPREDQFMRLRYRAVGCGEIRRLHPDNSGFSIGFSSDRFLIRLLGVRVERTIHYRTVHIHFPPCEL